MVGTLKAQLAEHRMSHRFDEVLREVAVVRRELGYPGMATPFSQLVGIQAVMNVVKGQRYAIVPDEIVQYAAGLYGQPVSPIESNVLDRIMASPHARKLAAEPPEQPTLQELRKRHGTDDDDELILRALMPAADLKKMRDAGPLRRDYPLYVFARACGDILADARGHGFPGAPRDAGVRDLPAQMSAGGAVAIEVHARRCFATADFVVGTVTIAAIDSLVRYCALSL
ncbi:MAG: hypothetical protein ACT4QA_05025 [Panacagrimonas sp.]